MACATVRRLVIGFALVRIMPAPRFNLAIQRSQTNERRSYSRTNGRRGSVAFQVERIHARCVSSVTDNARDDPARKFR